MPEPPTSKLDISAALRLAEAEDGPVLEEVFNSEHQRRSPPPSYLHPPREPRPVPLLFPTLADLPGLLVSLSSILRNSDPPQLRRRLRSLSSHQSYTSYSTVGVHERESGSWSVVSRELGETWSELLRRTEANPQFAHVDPLDALMLQNFYWPGKHCSSRSLHHKSSKSCSRFTEDDGIYETQVITTELDAFITALQDKKINRYQRKEDEDSLEAEEERLKTYRRGIHFMLFVLVFFIIGNIAGGVYLVAWTLS